MLRRVIGVEKCPIVLFMPVMLFAIMFGMSRA